MCRHAAKACPLPPPCSKHGNDLGLCCRLQVGKPAWPLVPSWVDATAIFFIAATSFVGQLVISRAFQLGPTFQVSVLSYTQVRSDQACLLTGSSADLSSSRSVICVTLDTAAGSAIWPAEHLAQARAQTALGNARFPKQFLAPAQCCVPPACRWYMLTS